MGNFTSYAEALPLFERRADQRDPNLAWPALLIFSEHMSPSRFRFRPIVGSAEMCRDHLAAYPIEIE